MEEKEIKEVYDNLSDQNKEVLNLIAKGMKVAQENQVYSDTDSVKEK